MDQNSLDSIVTLIDILNDAPVLTTADTQRLSAGTRPSFIEQMFQTGVTYGSVAGFPAFYQSEEREFFSYLKSKKDDLEFNIRVIEHFLKLRYSSGEIIPPYYADRVAIILRKMKQPDIEFAFLAAWCRHFGPDGGARFAALQVRYEKMRANRPARP